MTAIKLAIIAKKIPIILRSFVTTANSLCYRLILKTKIKR